MASCLGIYIDRNIIKYAKITKEKDDLKVDAFGIKIYSDLFFQTFVNFSLNSSSSLLKQQLLI